MAEPLQTEDGRPADHGRPARDPRQLDLGPQARRNAPADEARPSQAKRAAPPAGGGGDDKEKADSHDKAPKPVKEDDADEDAAEKGDETTDKPSPLKKRWVQVAIGVVVVVVVVVGALWLYRWWTHGRFVQSTNNAYLQADQVTVSAKVSGTVERVFVGDNQPVQAGDPLLKIDDSGNRARLQQALAQAAQARASIRQYEAQIGEQEATIAQAAASVQGAEAQRRYSQAEVDRYEPLARSGSEPTEKLSQKVSNRDQAVSTLRQNQAQALQARRRIATLRAQIGMARAQLEQAEAQARQAQIDVDSSLVRASVDGRVGDRQVRVGQEAQVGTRFLTIVPVQSIYLVANYKETQIGLMRVGQPASVKVDALDGVQLEGTVDSFSPATGASFALIPANNATGNFTKIVQRVPVRIRIEAGVEARKVLVPGLSAEVAVDTLGRQRDADRREDEARQGQDERKERTEDSIERDRRQPASGAGR